MKKSAKKRPCVRAVAIDDDSLESYETIYLYDKSGEEWKIRRLKRENTLRFFCKKHPQFIEIGTNRDSYFSGLIEVTNCYFREYCFLRNFIHVHTNDEIWNMFYNGIKLDKEKGYCVFIYK